MGRLKLAVNHDFRMSESEMLKLHFAVKDLLRHKPVQYITGEVLFCGITFQVDPCVLIPRPETEEMTLMTIELLKQSSNGAQFKILDIGTGSGCIAISLKLAFHQAEVYAMDVDAKVLALASKNAQTNNASVHFSQSDISNPAGNFEGLKFDLIISNPPYVTETDKNEMKQNVLAWEPELALFAPVNDPLHFYKTILRFAEQHLNNNGTILLEINEKLGKETAQLFAQSGYSPELLKDLRGKERFLKCTPR